MDERIAAGSSMALQRIPIAPSRFTREKRRRFLDALAATCNVRMAAEAAGVCKSSCYRLRQRDASFADAWQAAIGIGYGRLEDALLGYVLARVEAADIDPDRIEPDAIGDSVVHKLAGREIPIEELRFALILLKHHGETQGRAPGGRARRVTAEETDAALRKKLDMLARQTGGHGA